MTGRLLGAACMLLAMGACSQPAEDSVVDDPRNFEPAKPELEEPRATTGLLFAGDEAAITAGEFAFRYWVPEQKYIVARAPVEGTSAIQFLQLTLYQPSGDSYAIIDRAYTTDEDAPWTVNHPDHDGTIPVLQVVSGTPSYVVISIPIAGTDITQYQLFGIYGAELRHNLDASDEPVEEGSFEILYAGPEGM